MTSLTFQLGTSSKDANPIPTTRSWDEWALAFQSPDIRSVKDGAYFGAYTLDGTGRRRAENLTGYAAIVLDVDTKAVSVPVAAEAMSRFGWASALYTTFSSTPTAPRYRVILPIEGVMPVEYLHSAVQTVATWLNLDIDPASWSRSQMMFMPACADPSAFQSHVVHGQVMPVEILLAAVPAPSVEDLNASQPEEWHDSAVEGSQSDNLTMEELQQILTSMKSARSVFDGGVSAKQIWGVDEDALAKRWPSENATKTFDRSAALQALALHAMWVCGHNHERALELLELSEFRELYDDDFDWDRRAKQALSNPKFKNYDSFYGDRSAKNVETFQQQVTAAAPPSGFTRPLIEPGVVMFGKEQMTNALQFREYFYPSGSFISIDEIDYRYTGKVWEAVSDATLRYEITIAAMASIPPLQSAGVDGTIKMLRNMSHVPGAKLGDFPGHDTNRLINFDNGVLDLDTLQLVSHDPKWLTTNILPYGYDPAATCPSWEAFLESVFEGDAERVHLLQEWLGYMLTGSYEYQKAMLMIGAPRSGKGTIGRVLKELVGPYNYAGVSLEGLAVDSVLDAVSDKPVVFIGDAHTVSANSRSTVLSNLKQIIGNDDVSFNRKWVRHAHNGALPCRFTIAANGVPGFIDDSGALTNRFLILPFNKSFLGSEDPFLTDRLLKELPGICNWAVRGLARLRSARRFTEVAAAAVEREDMEARYSPLRVFVTECCVMASDQRVGTEELYTAYSAWSIRSGGHKMARQSFVAAMRSTFRGQIDKRSVRFDDGTRQGFLGVGLAPAVAMAGNAPGLQLIK